MQLPEPARTLPRRSYAARFPSRTDLRQYPGYRTAYNATAMGTLRDAHKCLVTSFLSPSLNGRPRKQIVCMFAVR